MHGRTVFGQYAKGERVGGQSIVMWFEADDERYKWLNDAICVVEGVIAGLGAISFRVFECVNEFIQPRRLTPEQTIFGANGLRPYLLRREPRTRQRCIH
jgi:hypothetical protein